MCGGVLTRIASVKVTRNYTEQNSLKQWEAYLDQVTAVQM